MINIIGKCLIFTDIHFGLNNNSDVRLDECKLVCEKINNYKISHNIRNIIFLGDFFHYRDNINIKTLITAYNCLNELVTGVDFYFIVGNHDMYHRNTTECSSCEIFQSIPNFHLINKTTEVSINGNKSLFIPYISSLEVKERDYDMVFGHFEVTTDFVDSIYRDTNTNKHIARKEYLESIDEDDLINSLDVKAVGFKSENDKDTYVNRKKASELIGDVVYYVKPKTGVIFSGHYHLHKEFLTDTRKFIFVGSPYQQTVSEESSTDGFYVINEDNSYFFEELTGMPVNVEIRISDILNDRFDFSSIKGNVIHYYYDVYVDNVTDASIKRRVEKNTPFMIVSPIYIDDEMCNRDKNLTLDEADRIVKRNKLEQLNNFIGKISEDELTESGVNRREILETIETYYNIAEKHI